MIAYLFLIVSLLLIGGSILIILVAWTRNTYTYFFRRARIRHPQKVNVVSEMYKDDDGDDELRYYIIYKYEYKGVQYQAQDPTSYNKEPKKGRASIWIDRRNPYKILEKSTGFFSYLYVIVLAGAVGLIIEASGILCPAAWGKRHGAGSGTSRRRTLRRPASRTGRGSRHRSAGW